MDQDAVDSADRLQAIIDSAVDGIISIDAKGIIESINPAAVGIFGFSRTELIGTNVRLLMPDPDRTKHDEYLENYHRTGDAKIIGIGREVIGRRKDGSEFPLYLAVSQGVHRGEQIFTGIVRDLSALRMAEKRAKSAEQLASLSLIAAGIAHDIGTPMNVILGYSEMLRGSLESPKNRRRAGVISEQVRRVTDLLQTLLNIARPRDPIRSTVRVDEVFEHALDFFQEKLAGRGIQIERDLSAVPELMGDSDRLEQVFLNLIVNAEDAMRQGGKLVARLHAETRDTVTIEISDTGHGMDAETMSHIFDPFYSTKDPGKGTGLGLVVAKSIVSDHGGSIDCESEPGKGTRFRIRLPTHASASE
jgi:PAS domain S-box-containing protein